MVKSAEFHDMLSALFRKSIEQINRDHASDLNKPLHREIPYTIKQIISKTAAPDHFLVKTMITTDGCDYTNEGGVMVCFKQRVQQITGFDMLLNCLVEPNDDERREFFVSLNKKDDTVELVTSNDHKSAKQTIRIGNIDHLFALYLDTHTAIHEADALNSFFGNAIGRYFDLMGGSVIEMNSRLAISCDEYYSVKMSVSQIGDEISFPELQPVDY